MPISASEREIQRLVRYYRKAIRDLAKGFASAADFEKGRFLSQIQGTLGILEDLDAKTARWAQRNIGRLYKASSQEANATLLRKLGVSKRDIERARGFSLINNQAIQALMVDPEVGFLTGTRQAIQQIKDRMRLIRNQAKLLRTKQKLFDETIARVGFLEGKSLPAVRDRIVDEMVKMKNTSNMVWTKAAAQLPSSEIVSNVANLPFVKVPMKTAKDGFRRLRIDRYAELLARTKSNQAANLARRNTSLEHNIPLVQISKNKPLQDDACFLYIGKVFALTASGKREFGVPMVNELPNGGAPFHPNCTHTENVFVPEYHTVEELRLALQPPPEWALNKTWGQVQKEYSRRVKKGGIQEAYKANPAAERFGRTTGGRERRRAEAGLEPDLPTMPEVITPPAQKTPTVFDTKPSPQSILVSGPPPVSFQVPSNLSSLQANDAWNVAMKTSSVAKDAQSILEDLIGQLSRIYG